MEEDKSIGVYEPRRSFLLAQVKSEFCSLCGWNDSLCLPLPQRRAEINRNTFQIPPGHPPCLPRFPSISTIFSRQLKFFSLNMQTPARAWFAAAQPGTQALFLHINTCVIDSSFPRVPKKPSPGPPNSAFAVPGAGGSSRSRSPFHATSPSVSPYAAFSPRPAFLPSLSASSQTGSGSRQPCGLFAQRQR